MRRPPGRRVVGSSGPPSCPRRSSQLWFVAKAKHKTGSERAVDWAKTGEKPKTITAASYGRTVLRTSLRVAAQASVIDIWRCRIEKDLLRVLPDRFEPDASTNSNNGTKTESHHKRDTEGHICNGSQIPLFTTST